MGVASFREDIYQRFLAASDPLPDVDANGIPRPLCPFCKGSFEHQHALLAHLSEVHRGDRPILMLHGREPDRLDTVRHGLHKDQIVIQNCTSASVRTDGGPWIHVSPKRLAPLLADRRDALFELELANHFDRSAAPIRQHYRLTVCVPEKSALDGVDRAFTHYLANGAPHTSQVTAFLYDRRCTGVVADYADALAAYVHGVLIKDQALGTGITLPPAEARDLYGSALDRLKTYRRLLPNVICALIRFAMNDFSLSDRPSAVERLDSAVAVLAPLLGRTGPGSSATSLESGRMMALCPVDHGVDRVLGLAHRLATQSRWGPTLAEECRQAGVAGTLESADREKILALWAVTALRFDATADAIEPLRHLRATYPFGDWADSELGRIEGSKDEHH